MNYVVPLSDIGLADVPAVGMKAAVLGDLRHAGFRVPDGFVITTEALLDTLGDTEPGLDPDTSALPFRRCLT